MHLEEFFLQGMDRGIRPPLDGYSWLPHLNLGGSSKSLPGRPVNLDLPDWNAETDPIPYSDGGVGLIWALHFFEHIRNFIGVLQECERVLTTGGLLNVCVPYGTCHMAVQDCTHVRFFNEDTWKELFVNDYYRPYGRVSTLEVRTNVIMGVKGTNLALLTQLVKR
jgi:predicted SAM-dependent methyltransferase